MKKSKDSAGGEVTTLPKKICLPSNLPFLVEEFEILVTWQKGTGPFHPTDDEVGLGGIKMGDQDDAGFRKL